MTMEDTEIIRRGEAAFRLLFTTPDRTGELQTDALPFTQLLKGIVDAASGKLQDAGVSDYFNALFRTFGKKRYSVSFARVTTT